MEISSKKLERSAKLVYFIISIALCVFLALLTNKIVEDLDSAIDYPIESSFENSAALDRIRAEITPIDDTLRKLNNVIERIDKTTELATQKYNNEKQSYENWLSARKTIGSPDQDEEVLVRARQLDEFFKIQEDWSAQKNRTNAQIEHWNVIRSQKVELTNAEMTKANDLYLHAIAGYETKVFGLRLLLVTPILLLGIYFFIKLRKNKFWPLFRGFSLFSLYVFFVGLVPYLPSYGGYIRYAVGVGLSIFLGYYAIRRLRMYMDKKKQELETSSKERAQNVQIETAERALNTHVCPSCGKDFILRNWEVSSESLKNSSPITDYCRFCGLELFAACTSCGTVNYVHLPYCSKCGTKKVKKD